MGSLLHSGSAEQKAEWLPKIASGELRLQAFEFRQPGAGPPLRRVVELPSAGSPDVGYLERPAVCARIRSDAAQFHGRYGAFA